MPTEMVRLRAIVHVLHGLQACGVPQPVAAKLAVAIVDGVTSYALQTWKSLDVAEREPVARPGVASTYRRVLEAEQETKKETG
jgi:hypothetical protein